MKRLLLLIFLLSSFISYAQLTDDFSDGNFTSNPAWTGDTAQFIVNGAKQLQLNSSGAGTSVSSTSNNLSSLDSIEWHSAIQLTFAPSSDNYGRVYLYPIKVILADPLMAITSNSVKLVQMMLLNYFVNRINSTSVCRGINGQIANAFAIGVRVTRDATGLWSLYVHPTGGTNYDPSHRR